MGENDRVYLVVAAIIATLGIPHKVSVLEKKELESKTFIGERDGDILIRRIEAFLNEKQPPRLSNDGNFAIGGSKNGCQRIGVVCR